MLITNYGINIGGSENKKRWPIGIVKHAHFIGGKPPRRGENMSSNKSSPRLHHRQKSYRGGKNILKTRLWGFFFPSTRRRNSVKIHQLCGTVEMSCSSRARLRCAFSFSSPPRLTFQPVQPHRMWCCPSEQHSRLLSHLSCKHSKYQEKELILKKLQIKSVWTHPVMDPPNPPPLALQSPKIIKTTSLLIAERCGIRGAKDDNDVSRCLSLFQVHSLKAFLSLFWASFKNH